MPTQCQYEHNETAATAYFLPPPTSAFLVPRTFFRRFLSSLICLRAVDWPFSRRPTCTGRKEQTTQVRKNTPGRFSQTVAGKLQLMHPGHDGACGIETLKVAGARKAGVSRVPTLCGTCRSVIPICTCWHSTSIRPLFLVSRSV